MKTGKDLRGGTANLPVMDITWYGHAAFLVQADGLRIMLDPYRTPDVGGYAPVDDAADVVLVSHVNEKYHSHWGAARGTPVRLNGLDFADSPEGVEARGVRFRAVKVYESPWRDVPVSMPYFTLGGVSVCHSGDLGHALSAEEAAPLRGVDVFLAVAGGPPTIEVEELRAAIDLIGPRIVIPMHYQTGKVNLDLRPLDDLLALFPPEQVVHHPAPTLTVTPGTLPTQTTLVVMSPAR